MHASPMKGAQSWADDVVMFLENGVTILLISRFGSEGLA